MDRDGYYISTPIYYVNGPPHFAHAYTSVAADALARFHRLDGRRVHFVSGTDEHGQKVAQAALAAGLDPQRFCDGVSAQFEMMGGLMNISNDDFIRTTELRHIEAARHFWRAIEAGGDIYQGEFAGWYAVRDEAFYDDAELVDGMAPTGASVEWVKERNYFFRLSAWQDRLLAFYDAHPDFILPAGRRNEVINFVKGGLNDLSISRSSVRWGIPVPDDEAQVMYVWVDALTNYISALGYPDTGGDLWQRFWPADLHLVGKDIVRFHCVYWPALLMAAGLEPPHSVFAHGWWTVEGEKMSKSLNNFIAPAELTDAFGVDAVRYFMLRELSFGQDGNLARKAITVRANADLANGLGNLAQRVLSLIQRDCMGRIPRPGKLNPADSVLLDELSRTLELVRQEMHEHALHRALESIWKLVSASDRYVDEQKPWTLASSNPARLQSVLYVLVETLRHVAILAQPFIPSAAASLLDQLGVSIDERSFASLTANPVEPGTLLPPPVALFRRLDIADDSRRPPSARVARDQARR